MPIEINQESHRIGMAVVGCGYWGVNYVRLFSELPGSRVVAVCDQAPESLERVRRSFPDIDLSACLEHTLTLPQVDAVVVCTQATSHYALAREALLAGKDVLVEKPITTNADDAEKLGRLAESQALILMVGHTFIYNSGVRKVKEFIDLNDDQIYYLHARRTNLGPIRHDVNAVWDLATHDIAIFNYLLNRTPDWVSAVGAKVLRNCREDVGFVALGYSGNVLGHIHVSWADPNKAREMVVVCSNNRIVFNDLNGMERVRIFQKGIRPVEQEPLNYGEHRLQVRDGDILSPRVEPTEPLKEQCQHFLHCIQHRTRPLTGGREGVDVLRVLEAVDRSILANGAQVEVAKGAISYQIAA